MNWNDIIRFFKQILGFHQARRKAMTTTTKPYSDAEKLRELSFQYIIDAYQFVDQAEILLNHESLSGNCKCHIGYISKISVMLYMSIECSLKSMICGSHLGESPRFVYWEKIRKGRHNFEQLISEIDDFSAKINDSSLESELKRLSSSDVSERYCIEVSSASGLLGDFNLDESDLDGLVKENKNLFTTAKSLSKKVWALRQSEFKGHRTLPPSEVKTVLKEIKTK
jgi:hypothetical protein